jgi:hypothetical protein
LSWIWVARVSEKGTRGRQVRELAREVSQKVFAESRRLLQLAEPAIRHAVDCRPGERPMEPIRELRQLIKLALGVACFKETACFNGIDSELAQQSSVLTPNAHVSS